ncbi:hypothetical protein Tco_1538938 [Tanacetum coccineum]
MFKFSNTNLQAQSSIALHNAIIEAVNSSTIVSISTHTRINGLRKQFSSADVSSEQKTIERSGIYVVWAKGKIVGTRVVQKSGDSVLQLLVYGLYQGNLNEKKLIGRLILMIRAQDVQAKPAIYFGFLLQRKDFSKSTTVTTKCVQMDFSKPVTAQILPQNMLPIVKNTNVIAPGMYKVHTKPNQTRTPQLHQDIRKPNKRVSFSTGVIPNTSVSRPQLKSNHLKDRVMSNNSQGKKQEVEDHRRKFKFSNNKTSVTACNDSLNAKTSNVNFLVEIILFIVDSGCSKHMTGNLKLLNNFVEKFLGTIWKLLLEVLHGYIRDLKGNGSFHGSRGTIFGGLFSELSQWYFSLLCQSLPLVHAADVH